MKLKCIEVACDVGYLTAGREYPANPMKGFDYCVEIADDEGEVIAVNPKVSAFGKFEVIP